LNTASFCWFIIITTTTTKIIMPLLSESECTALLESLDVTIEKGLAADEALKRRESCGYFNTVDPPIQCPAWVCCLLPCIKHIPSMKLFRSILAEDAEVIRDGRWIRYDASSLVRGDIIRILQGDVVPADCTVLKLVLLDTTSKAAAKKELLVDHRWHQTNGSPTSNPSNLYWGEQIVEGACLAVCTAIGPETKIAQYIRTRQFPLPDHVVVGGDVLGSAAEEMDGISLLPTKQQQQRDDSFV
jgi:E1-E2 ATPase